VPTIESYREPLPLIEEETETETERQSLSPEPDWNNYLTQPGSHAQSQTLPELLIQFKSLSLRMAQQTGTTAAAVLNKEIKMNTPTPFTGKREKLEEFLIELEMYLAMNADIYNTDQRKIIFTLSFMKEETAGSWKQSYWKQTQEQTQPWAPDKPDDVIIKMETEIMTSRTANEFIVSLLDKILNLENPPTMIVGWYTTALKLDNQWRRGQAITNRLKGGTNTKKKGFHFPNKNTPWYVPPVDPNAMEIDRLMAQEQANHMKKGLCFVCHQAGHRANDHGPGSSTGSKKTLTPYTLPANTHPTFSEAKGAYAHIKTIYGGLSDEEKKKLTDAMEDQGF